MSDPLVMVHGRHAGDHVPRTGARRGGEPSPDLPRLTRALRLRRTGLTFAEVGAAVGCRRDRARQMVIQAERLMLLPFAQEIVE